MKSRKALVEIRAILNKIQNSSEDFSKSKLKLIKNGHNRSIYLLKAKSGKKYIVKKGNDAKDLGSINLNDVRAQSFLRQSGCNFVPEIIYWDKESDLYIESYVGDKDIPFKSLKDKDLEVFAKQLAIVHSFSADQYVKFCQNNKFDIPKITTPVEDLKTFGFDRYNIAKETCKDEKVIKWLSQRLLKSLEITKNPETVQLAPHFCWGDIGNNIRTDKSGKIYFIDWEFSKIGQESELAYIKIHSKLKPKQFKKLVTLYVEYRNAEITTDALRTAIINSEKVTRTNDVVWAAMKWGQTKTRILANKYKNLTYKRISLAEKLDSHRK